MKLLRKEDIEDSIIQAVVGVVTGTTAGIIVLAWSTFKFVHPLDPIVLGLVFTVFVIGAVLLAFLGIVACKYIIRMPR